jgi:hypothetical protein
MVVIWSLLIGLVALKKPFPSSPVSPLTLDRVGCECTDVPSFLFLKEQLKDIIIIIITRTSPPD